MNNAFEVTTQYRTLAKTGREMMDFSEFYGVEHGLGHLKDDQLAVLNRLTHVGGLLTKMGVTFGPRLSDLTDGDKELIAKFSKKELDLQNV
jgi:hypothetical protein